MRKSLLRRHRTDLLLDALFALWVLHVLITGSLVPSAITTLLRNESPVVAVSEPAQAPQPLEQARPSLPET
jgi:hypothetical protein